MHRRVAADRRSAIFQAVDAAHPVEGVGHRVGLAALQRADEVPLEAQVTQRLDLVDAFQHVASPNARCPAAAASRTAAAGQVLLTASSDTADGSRPAAARAAASMRARYPHSPLADCRHIRGLFPWEAIGEKHSIARVGLDGPRFSPCFGPLTGILVQTKTMVVDITELLAFAVKNKASDLHLLAGLLPDDPRLATCAVINLPPPEHKDVHAMVSATS